MFADYLLVWVFVVTIVCCSDVKRIWCLDEKAKGHKNLIKNISRDDMLCDPKIISDYPWGEKSDRTSPSPRDLNINYFTYKKDGVNATRQIAINITWKQKANILKDSDSYHLEISYLRPPGPPKQYNIIWDKRLPAVLETNPAFRYTNVYINVAKHLVVGGSAVTSMLQIEAQVEFCFIYTGNLIKPNQFYKFSLQGVPLYREEDKPQRILRDLRIPGCKDKELSKTEYCAKPSRPKGYKRRGRKYRPSQPSSKMVEPSILPVETSTISSENEVTATKEPNLVMTFLIIGAIILSMLFLLIIFIFLHRRLNYFQQCCTGKKILPPKECDQRILIIRDTKTDRFSEAIKELVCMLHGMDQLNVTTNAHHTVEIGEKGLFEWTKNMIDQVDFVIFLASDRRTFFDENCDETMLEDGLEQQVILNVVRNILHTSLKATPEHNHKKFIIADLNNCVTKKNFPYFQHYKLPNGFKNFTKHLIGHLRVNEKDKTIFINLLTNAQLGHGKPSVQSIGDHCAKRHPVSHRKEHNDLDTAENSHVLNTNREELNIEMDGPPSCETNTNSGNFISTDYNDPMDRYRQAGARPKTQCKSALSI